MTFLALQGIAQFLDIGSGIPTVGSVHEIAWRVNQAARVMYVDNDPIAVRQSAALLQQHPLAAIIRADARQPEHILDHADTQRLLDFTQPIGLLLVAVLHFISDDAEAQRLVRVLRDAHAPGSYVAISHITNESLPADIAERTNDLYARSTNPVKLRARKDIEQFFDGWDVIEPGLVYLPRWWPESDADLLLDQPERSVCLAGVGRK